MCREWTWPANGYECEKTCCLFLTFMHTFSSAYKDKHQPRNSVVDYLKAIPITTTYFFRYSKVKPQHQHFYEVKPTDFKSFMLRAIKIGKRKLHSPNTEWGQTLLEVDINRWPFHQKLSRISRNNLRRTERYDKFMNIFKTIDLKKLDLSLENVSLLLLTVKNFWRIIFVVGNSLMHQN